MKRGVKLPLTLLVIVLVRLLLGLLRIRALEILHYNILLLILILCHLKILQKYC